MPVVELACAHCGDGFRGGRPGARFCSGACRMRAYRRRRAGLREGAYVEGALRGGVPLERPTRRELAASIATAQPR